jgi:hypothetical protein
MSQQFSNVNTNTNHHNAISLLIYQVSNHHEKWFFFFFFFFLNNIVNIFNLFYIRIFKPIILYFSPSLFLFLLFPRLRSYATSKLLSIQIANVKAIPSIENKEKEHDDTKHLAGEQLFRETPLAFFTFQHKSIGDGWPLVCPSNGFALPRPVTSSFTFPLSQTL